MSASFRNEEHGEELDEVDDREQGQSEAEAEMSGKQSDDDRGQSPTARPMLKMTFCAVALIAVG